MFSVLILTDHLSVILGVSGGCLLLILILVVLIYAKRRAKERENVYKKWIINYSDITPSDDSDDNHLIHGSFHQVSLLGWFSCVGKIPDDRGFILSGTCAIVLAH